MYVSGTLRPHPLPNPSKHTRTHTHTLTQSLTHSPAHRLMHQNECSGMHTHTLTQSLTHSPTHRVRVVRVTGCVPQCLENMWLCGGRVSGVLSLPATLHSLSRTPLTVTSGSTRHCSSSQFVGRGPRAPTRTLTSTSRPRGFLDAMVSPFSMFYLSLSLFPVLVGSKSAPDIGVMHPGATILIQDFRPRMVQPAPAQA